MRTRTSRICVGRDRLCDAVVANAVKSGSVLLFGGRQCGKTTVLLRLAERAEASQADTAVLSTIELPVYVDLMRLPYDAGPSAFFRQLLECAETTCRARIKNWPTETAVAHEVSFDLLVQRLTRLFEHSGEIDLRLVFLIDEAKRILGARFPRGVQDNLFALLHGDLPVSDRCSMVFAGGQELYSFCEDDTSPIGSRSVKLLVKSLDREALGELLEAVNQAGDRVGDGLAERIYEQTSGQAALSHHLAEAMLVDGAPDLGTAVQDLQSRYSQLFSIWRGRLSTEARIIHDGLVTHGSMTRRQIAEMLAERGCDPFKSDRAREELEFTGIAAEEYKVLRAANAVYRTAVADFVIEPAGSPDEEETWSLIRELEVALRGLVWTKYASRWGDGAESKLQSALGEKAWSRILENRAQSGYKNGRLATPPEPILSFAYLGQLGALVIWGPAWDMFKGMFRDKREVEDLLRGITPVRNDVAHFRAVPAKELARCRVAADDFISMIENASRSVQ